MVNQDEDKDESVMVHQLYRQQAMNYDDMHNDNVYYRLVLYPYKHRIEHHFDDDDYDDDDVDYGPTLMRLLFQYRKMNNVMLETFV